MSFLSFDFLLAAILALAAFYALPLRWRPGFLLAASLLFFALAGPVYLPLIVLLTLGDFFLARAMPAAGPGRRRRLLAAGLLLNAGVLVFFKYAAWLDALAAALWPAWGRQLAAFRGGLLVPLGLSYFTFKKISYLLDCYWLRLAPERRFSRLLLYVAFFLEISAGPIDRAGRLLPQFDGGRDFCRADFSAGLHQVLWGLFKKLVVADRLAALADPVFLDPGRYQAQAVLAAALAYSLQIYADFSGYSDMAIGLGRLFGYRLQANFDRPYFALSLGDFWRRWHVSLSQWLRDYLFLPLSFAFLRRFPGERLLGRPTEAVAYACASLATMALCGLWHGAAWTFLAWGLLHGFYLAAGYFSRRARSRARRALGLAARPALNRAWRRLATFLLVSLAWIVFRSPSLASAGEMFAALLAPGRWLAGGALGFRQWLAGAGTAEAAVALAAVALLLLLEALQGRVRFGRMLRAWPWPLRWAAYYLVVFAILLFGVFAKSEFVYRGF